MDFFLSEISLASLSTFFFKEYLPKYALGFSYFFCFQCICDLIYHLNSKYIIYIFIDFGVAECFYLSLFITDLKAASQLPCCHQYYKKMQTAIIGSIFHKPFLSLIHILLVSSRLEHRLLEVDGKK